MAYYCIVEPGWYIASGLRIWTVFFTCIAPPPYPDQAPEDMPPLEGEDDDASRMEEVD